MKRSNKIAIFLVALVITLVGFNFVASSATLAIFDLGRAEHREVFVTVTAEVGPVANTVVEIRG